MRRRPGFVPALALFVLTAAGPALAQGLVLSPPGDNQRAAVTQQIGPVKVTIDYSSPRVVLTGPGPEGEDLGRARPVRPLRPRLQQLPEVPVAGRREHEHDLRRRPRREGRGADASRREVRPPHDSRRDGVDRHLLEGQQLLGELLVRPEGRRAPGHREAGEVRVPRVADVRVPGPRAGERDRRHEVGGAAGPDPDQRPERQGALGGGPPEPAPRGRRFLVAVPAAGGRLVSSRTR